MKLCKWHAMRVPAKCSSPVRLRRFDIPTFMESIFRRKKNLLRTNERREDIAKKIGCDWVMYQDLADLEDAVASASSADMPVSGKLCSMLTSVLCQYAC